MHLEVNICVLFARILVGTNRLISSHESGPRGKWVTAKPDLPLFKRGDPVSLSLSFFLSTSLSSYSSSGSLSVLLLITAHRLTNTRMGQAVRCCSLCQNRAGCRGLCVCIYKGLGSWRQN